MATKTFRAETIKMALEQVQEELGPDAIVLSVREIPVGPAWQVWRQPGCEVIAARNAAEAESESKEPSPQASTSRGLPSDEIADGVEWIEEPLPPLKKKQVSPSDSVVRSAVEKDMKGSRSTASLPKAALPWQPPRLEPVEKAIPVPKPVQEPAPAPAKAEEKIIEPKAEPRPAAPVQKNSTSPILAKNQQRLRAQGVDEDLINRVITTCAQAFGQAAINDENRCQAYLQRQLESGLKVQSRSMVEKPNRITCLVGPSGSGKTSTCARLAAYYGLQGKKVAWICVDTIRAGAIAEARTFVEALGIPLHVAYTPEELTWKIELVQDADLVLVDTPGYNPCNEAQMVELGSFLSQIPQRCTYLMAPATTKEADLGQAYAALRPFNIRGLILTKLDETLCLGNVYNFAWRTQLPLAYFTSGKQVVEDFSPANVNWLVAALFRNTR
jgi:flagellar biosynthesis protein FlhF